MIRTQISLTEEQAVRLHRVAAQRGTSMAAVIREAVDTVIVDQAGVDRRELIDRALSVIGKYSGDGSNVSEDHDAYLDEIYGTW